jgi:hypothetical protein
MNTKRIISLALVAVMLVSVMSFTGCDILDQILGSQGGGATGKNTLLMEAEYTYLDDVAGAGLSDNTSGLSMIYGNGTEDQKAMWSNGYYVGYMYNTSTVLTFEFNSSAATTATITFALACEQKDHVLTSGENIEILVNGESVYFNPMSIKASEMHEAKFSNYTLSNVELAAGANKIEIKVITPVGTLVDCVKVVASDATVELSWEPHEDNAYRRDNEV